MAKSAGRLCFIKKGATNLAGLRVNSITVDNTFIDTTTKSDSEFSSILSGTVGSTSITITGDGLIEDQTLRDLAMSADEADRFITDLTYAFENGDVISGNFVINSYSEGSPYQEATTFTANFTGNGAWTFTAGV